MKTRNEFKSYLVIWVLAIIIFNILAFVFYKELIINGRITEVARKFNDGTIGTKEVLSKPFLNLLISYVFVMLTFVGQLICTKIFLSQASLKDTLYHYPFFSLSLQGLIFTIIFAVVFCIITIPPIVAFLVFLILLSITIFRCTAAKTAANMVIAKDENISVKTEFIKTLKVESAALLARVRDNKEKDIVKKVVDAIKYSDPVSIPELNDVESNMVAKYTAFVELINKGDADKLKIASEEFLDLLNERNIKVKSLKKM